MTLNDTPIIQLGRHEPINIPLMNFIVEGNGGDWTGRLTLNVFEGSTCRWTLGSDRNTSVGPTWEAITNALSSNIFIQHWHCSFFHSMDTGSENWRQDLDGTIVVNVWRGTPWATPQNMREWTVLLLIQEVVIMLFCWAFLVRATWISHVIQQKNCQLSIKGTFFNISQHDRHFVTCQWRVTNISN